ncbi:hypothetical protein B0F88_10154 [Methylobacter tundripaludum]|uniref:Uncharacterized protein n=2 Tax=Methylobacter tundripaludum TaxID=173365 RepID=A0A2S6H801_9GAMM|nr:hypothetical protein B0F88_10154 [Methylobacter tundripaludum]
MIPMHEDIELILVPAPSDAPPFSSEYQTELREFAKQAGARSQRAFVMDSISGGGGPLGEFIFDNAGTVIVALTSICGIWIRAKYGRKLKLKVGKIVVEANTTEEIELLVKQVKTIQDKSK